MDASSTDTPAKLLKLELGSQFPIKTPFKLKRDFLKVVQINNWEKNSPGFNLLNYPSAYWMNRTTNVVVNEYCDVGPIEFALPNSKTGFFYECVLQKLFGKIQMVIVTDSYQMMIWMNHMVIYILMMDE